MWRNVYSSIAYIQYETSPKYVEEACESQCLHTNAGVYESGSNYYLNEACRVELCCLYKDSWIRKELPIAETHSVSPINTVYLMRFYDIFDI